MAKPDSRNYSKCKMLQETLELKARRYAPIIHMENGDKIVLPAESFAMGDILITHPGELYAQLKAWQEFRRAPPADIRHMLFELKDSYHVQTPERTASGRYKTKKADLLELSPAELRFALLRKLIAEKRSKNLWNAGPNAVRRDKDRPYTGSAILTGKVKAMERGGRGNSTYYSVNVTNPFGLPEGFYCSCEDSRWTDAKEGRTSIDGACTHAAGLQTYVHYHPALARNFVNVSARGNKFILPFHFGQSQQHDLRKFGISIEELEHLSAQNLGLSHLKMDVLIDHLFNSATYFEIGKKLSLIPDIYDPALLDAVFKGKVFYETVIQKKVKRDSEEQQFFGMDRMIRDMMSFLAQDGYKLTGHPLEFRDSPWETVSWEYEKEKNVIRVISNGNFPPVYIYRKRGNGPKNPFLVERYSPRYHPFSNLFGQERRLDDRTKQITDFEVRIPIGIDIPASLRGWYRRTIAENFDGGIEALTSRVMARNQTKGLELAYALAH